MAPHCNIVEWCETHPHDLRRACSTLWCGTVRTKVDHNQTDLAAAMCRAALDELAAR